MRKYAAELEIQIIYQEISRVEFKEKNVYFMHVLFGEADCLVNPFRTYTRHRPCKGQGSGLFYVQWTLRSVKF